MLKFFRKIRRNLLTQGKTGKYFKYAIGEIILVVIGILIALSINNWNEAKQDRVFEVKMLAEINEALNTDKIYFEDMVNTFKELDSSSSYFMDISKSNIKFHDSIFNKIFGLNNGINFLYNPGPYDALKSSGIDRISNDSLRNNLINFFDFKISKLEKNIGHVTRNHQLNIEKLLSLFGERYVDDSRGQNSIRWRNAPKDVFQSQEFLEILSDVSWRARTAKQRIESFIPELQALIEHVSKEIEK